MSTAAGDSSGAARSGRGRGGFDPTCIDLTNVDLAHVARDLARRCGPWPSRAVGVARDATYVTVGLTILGIQRSQVRRRQLFGH